ETEELPVVSDDRVGPEQLADRDGLVDPTAARREVELGRRPFLFEPRRADTEQKAAARQQVHGLDSTRRGERVAKPDVEDVRTEPDAFGERRKVGEVREGLEHWK